MTALGKIDAIRFSPTWKPVMSSPSKLRGATTGHTWPSAIRENSHERAVNDRSVPQLWCYTDRLSCQPGDTIAFHLSGTGRRIGLAIIRDGGSEAVCHRHEVEARFHETPEQCS